MQQRHLESRRMNLETYLKDTLLLFLGLRKSFQTHLPAWPEKLRRLFTREEEYAESPRDQWGNWEHPFSENFHRNTLWQPEIDQWVQGIKKELKQQSIPLLPLWPQGYRFAACLTHDVDYVSDQMTFQQRGREIWRTLQASDLHSKTEVIKKILKFFIKRSYRNPSSARILDISCKIEKDLGVTSSYFFTPYPLSQYSQYDCLYKPTDTCKFLGQKSKVKDVMRWMVQEGFDVGLHGSYHSATQEGLLEEQKYLLEKALQTSISTTRQHWLHWHFQKTPQMQAKAGFLADTTLGFNRNIGFRAGTSLPFYLYDLKNQQELNLLEVPLIIQDGALLGNNALELPPEKALELSKKMIDHIADHEGCITLLFHPDMFTKKGIDRLYQEMIAYCLKQGAWVTNLSEIQKWWNSRRSSLFHETEKNRHHGCHL